MTIPLSAVLLPPVFDAETLAHRTLEALRGGDVVRALEFSQYFMAKCSHLKEAMLLHAVALSQVGESAIDAMLQAWERVLRRDTLQPDCLAQALRLAWQSDRTAYAERLTTLLHNLFLVAPPVVLLEELERRGEKVSGSVGIHDGRLRGWTWQPLDEQGGLPHFFAEADSATPPELSVESVRRLKTQDRVLNIFSLKLPEVSGAYTVRVRNGQGREVQGSPVVVSCLTPVRRKTLCKKVPRPVAIIIPVYADREATLACIGSVLASRKANRTQFELVTIWDCGPDAHLLANMRRLAERGKCTLHILPYNRGFLGAVNIALERHPGQSVVLLNADTLVHADWLDRLHRIASRPGVGTVTPFGTHAELLSFPAPQVKVSVTRLKQVRRLDDACRKANADNEIETIPVGVGFCMYIPRRTLDKIGMLDGRTLFRGYGEEVEFCLRARAHGLCSVAACTVFVGHVGERSFGTGKLALAAQNNTAIFARYPAYKDEYDNFVRTDPLRRLRERAACCVLEPLAGPLHIGNMLAGALPELLHLEEGSAMFLIQPCGDRVRAILRVQQGLPLPDMHFVLPEEFSALSHALKALASPSCTVHGPSPLVRMMLDRLGQPDCADASLLLPSTVETLSTTTLGGTTGRWILPPPRTLRDWQRLCQVARQAYGHIFKVLQLDAFWRYASRPLNIWAAPETDSLFLAADGLLLFDVAEYTPAWQRWAEENRLPVFLMKAPSTTETAGEVA